MRKVIKGLLMVAFAVLLINVSQVKAANEVMPVEGASIRSGGVQGLRFYATLDESVKESEHGFYLVYGKATVSELEQAISLAGEDPIMLNGKVVFVVPVLGVTAENGFSVVLTGIPKEGYLDQLTVIPYVIVDEELTLPTAGVTRSIGQVALNMANAGETPPEGILSTISGDYKRVAFNAFGELEITDNLFETNHFLLREEFIKDWNAKFGTTWTELDAKTFYNSAKTGLSGGANSNKDLSPSNLYKFFNDEVYGDKWMWVLDYIDLKGDVHPRRQIVAIKGDGTNADDLLYNAEHLGYSIPNFFNGRNDTTGYAAINFTSPSKYDSVKNYNDKIYVDVANYEYLAVGDSYTIPTPEARLGYNFSHYTDGETEINPGEYLITAENKVLEKVYQAITYTVKFYDGEVELTDLNTIYTIENAKLLPEPTKEGLLFEGWYDNPEFTGSAVLSVAQGSTGDKVYYAKFKEAVELGITLELDGGVFYLYESREAMVTDFMADFNAYFSDKPDISASEFQSKTYQWNVSTIFSSETYGAKWAWMRSYIIQVAADQSHGSEAGLTSNDDGTWRGSIDSFLNETVRTGWPSSADYTEEPAKNGFWPLLVDNDPLKDYEPGVAFTLPEPTKAGFDFAGWYDNDSFDGAAVTIIPAEQEGDLTLYAKWTAA